MKRKIVRLTESDLHRIVENSVKRILKETRLNKKTIKEGGHIASYDDEGKLEYTNSEDTWRGLNGSKFISHGEWSDPEIWYKGELYNYNEIEDSMWAYYKEYCEDTGETPTEDGFDEWANTQDLEEFLY